MSPVAGRDYPRSYAELRAWFDQDAKCLDYLDWLRWPDGFVCPGCGSENDKLIWPHCDALDSSERRNSGLLVRRL